MAPTDHSLVADVHARRAAVCAALADRGVDAALVTSEPGFTYLTGYVTPSWANRSRPMALLLHGDRALCFVSVAEAERVAELAVDVELEPYVEPLSHSVGEMTVMDFSHAVAAKVIVSLRDDDIGALAAELGAPAIPGLPYDALNSVREALGCSLIDIGPVLLPLRLRKSRREVGCARRAADALGRAFEEFGGCARPGMTERELHSALVEAAGRAGAPSLGYAVVVAGARSPLLGPPGDRVWSDGELLMVDVGMVVDGYWADFCRHFAAGYVTADQSAAYARVVAAVDAGRTTARAGVTASTVAAAMAEFLPVDGKRGFGRLGHGIGLDLTEPPSLHRADQTALEPGMTLCVEPAAWFEGVGHIVAEEMIAVTSSNAEVLSPGVPESIQVLSA